MHPVRQQQKHIAHKQIALRIVHHQRVFSPYATQQLMTQVGMVHHVVGGELAQLAAAQQVSPGVAHMRQSVRLAAQHDSGQGG